MDGYILIETLRRFHALMLKILKKLHQCISGDQNVLINEYIIHVSLQSLFVINFTSNKVA